MMFYAENMVRIAVDRLGGMTKAAIAMKCSGTTVSCWVRNRRVPDLDKATKLAELAGMGVKELRPCR